VAYAVSKSGQHYWAMEIGKSPAEQQAAKSGKRTILLPFFSLW